jgi:hypothetical protein
MAVQEPAVGSMHLRLVSKSIKVIVYCKCMLDPYQWQCKNLLDPYFDMLPCMFYDLVQLYKKPICMSYGDQCIWVLNL